jgi:hypothetical protein
MGKQSLLKRLSKVLGPRWSANDSYSSKILGLVTVSFLPSPASANPLFNICSMAAQPVSIQPRQGTKITKEPAETLCKYQILLKH